MNLRHLGEAMSAFVQEKGWYSDDSPRPQTPRNLAISLSLEAAEVLEHFQWNEEVNKEAVAQELADVIFYAIQLSTILGIDLQSTTRAKLALNLKRSWSASLKPTSVSTTEKADDHPLPSRD